MYIPLNNNNNNKASWYYLGNSTNIMLDSQVAERGENIQSDSQFVFHWIIFTSCRVPRFPAPAVSFLIFGTCFLGVKVKRRVFSLENGRSRLWFVFVCCSVSGLSLFVCGLVYQFSDTRRKQMVYSPVKCRFQPDLLLFLSSSVVLNYSQSVLRWKEIHLMIRI